MASEQVSSCGLTNGHPDEKGNHVYIHRVFLLTFKFKTDHESVKQVIKKIFRAYKVELDCDLLVNSNYSPLIRGTAYLVLVDAPFNKIDKMGINMMSVSARLIKQKAWGESKNIEFCGIKCFIESENPLSEEGTGSHCFMIHPTTENLTRLGFEIKLLENLKPVPTTFPAKTYKFNPIEFPKIGAAAEPVMVSNAAAMETPVVSNSPVKPVKTAPSAAAEKSEVNTPLAQSVQKLFDQPKQTVGEFDILPVNIGDQHVVESDGKIISLGSNRFKYVGATFVLVNNEVIKISGSTGFYAIE